MQLQISESYSIHRQRSRAWACWQQRPLDPSALAHFSSRRRCIRDCGFIFSLHLHQQLFAKVHLVLLFFETLGLGRLQFVSVPAIDLIIKWSGHPLQCSHIRPRGGPVLFRRSLSLFPSGAALAIWLNVLIDLPQRTQLSDLLLIAFPCCHW